MTSGIFTWMFPGWYATDWWKVNDTTCDQADIEKAATGSIGFVVSSSTDVDAQTDVSKVKCNINITDGNVLKHL